VPHGEEMSKELLRERDQVRQEWARRFLPSRDYNRIIIILGIIVGILMCGSIGGFAYTVTTMRHNQRELLCSLADTEELIVAYVEARRVEAIRKGAAPPPEPPSEAILREFSKAAEDLRERAGKKCPFPANSLLRVLREP
jgi:hypothetical protein